MVNTVTAQMCISHAQEPSARDTISVKLLLWLSHPHPSLPTEGMGQAPKYRQSPIFQNQEEVR